MRNKIPTSKKLIIIAGLLLFASVSMSLKAFEKEQKVYKVDQEEVDRNIEESLQELGVFADSFSR